MSRSHTRWGIILGIGCFWLGLVSLRLMGPALAQTVTQGYGADQSLQRGMLVRLKPKEPAKVVAVTSDTQREVHGVVVNANDSPLTISESDHQVFVATVGRYEVLVSDQNGNIGVGDYVSVSNLTGVGMKAANDQPVIVGKATTSFDASKQTISSQTINDKTVALGRITVDIGIARNPIAKTQVTNVPKLLQTASETIANKPVSPPRLYTSLVILLATIIISGSILYAGVRSSLISIGRNPLSRTSIVRGLLQVIGASVIILIVGIFGVYLLLKV